MESKEPLKTSQLQSRKENPQSREKGGWCQDGAQPPKETSAALKLTVALPHPPYTSAARELERPRSRQQGAMQFPGFSNNRIKNKTKHFLL